MGPVKQQSWTHSKDSKHTGKEAGLENSITTRSVFLEEHQKNPTIPIFWSLPLVTPNNRTDCIPKNAPNHVFSFRLPFALSDDVLLLFTLP